MGGSDGGTRLGGCAEVPADRSGTPPRGDRAATSDPLLASRDGPLLTLTLNRPDRLNAVSFPLYKRLVEELKRADADRDVRCVVLTGNGRAFCAGADLKAHRDRPQSSEERHRYTQLAQRANHLIQSIGTPVVAAVNGHAIGAGLELALSADFAIVAEDARLRLPEIALGTFVGGGAVYTLAERVGVLKAREIILLGDFFSGSEAAAMGVLNRAVPVAEVLAAATRLRPGGLALLVQSGNIALALMNEVTERTRMGISICCGLGNEVDVGLGEVLEFLGGHDETRAVIAHIEGCRDARAFLHAASEVTRRKPVVVIKSGRTGAGAHAALSHTGAVAGPYDRLRAGFAQAGVVEVRRTDELLRVAETLASQPPGPAGTGVAILSDGGGQSTLVVDALHEKGIPLAELSPRTSGRLRKLLGPAAAVRTPVDVAGAADADPGAFARALEVLARDPSVGIVMLVGLFGGYAIRFSGQLAEGETEAAVSMAATMRALGKGMVVHSQYASHESAALDALREAHVPVIGSLDVACRAVVELQRRGVGLARSAWWRPEEESVRITASPHHVINGARAEGRVTLDEMEARVLLGEAGLAFEPATVVRSAEQAAGAAAEAGRPVAIKLLSSHITHKSDAGGVVLDVRAGDEARDAFAGIAERAVVYARTHGLPEEDCAATVSPMLAPPVAELLVGAHRDPQLGPVLTVGAGGIWVEVLRDVAHRVLPVRGGEVAAAIGELKVSALLAGARGGRAVGLGRIVAAAGAVAECVMRWPDVAEVEVNPLFVYPDRVAPVDVRVVLGGVGSAGGKPITT